MNYADALDSLRPDCAWSWDKKDYSGITWHESNTSPIPSKEELDAEVARLEAEQAATEYKRLRAPEYPPIGDQLDAILKHLNYRRTQGDELIQEMDDIIDDWLSVKSRFPKND